MPRVVSRPPSALAKRALTWPEPRTSARAARRVAVQRLLPAALRAARRGWRRRASRAAVRGPRSRLLSLERRHLPRLRAPLPRRQGGAGGSRRHAQCPHGGRAGDLGGVCRVARPLRALALARVRRPPGALVRRRRCSSGRSRSRSARCSSTSARGSVRPPSSTRSRSSPARSVLGAVATGMLLGHWYLIDLGLSIDPLHRLLRYFVTVLVAQWSSLAATVLLLGLTSGEGGAAVARLWHEHGPLLATRLVPRSARRRSAIGLDDPPHARDPADHGRDRPLLHRDPRRPGRRDARPADPLPDLAAALTGRAAQSKTRITVTQAPARRPAEVEARQPSPRAGHRCAGWRRGSPPAGTGSAYSRPRRLAAERAALAAVVHAGDDPPVVAIARSGPPSRRLRVALDRSLRARRSRRRRLDGARGHGRELLQADPVDERREASRRAGAARSKNRASAGDRRRGLLLGDSARAAGRSRPRPSPTDAADQDRVVRPLARRRSPSPSGR